MKLRSCLAVFLLLLSVVAAATEVITEWQVPWTDGRPRDPYLDSKGNVWFCGQGGGYLARFEPATGKFQRFDLGEEKGPHNLIIDAQDRVWYAGNTTGHIGRLDPATGAIEKFPMPDEKAIDPHTLTWNRDGDIWFTMQHGNIIGRLAVQDGKVDLVAVPTPSARPYGIVIAPDNRPWVVLFGTNKLATVDPATLELREITLPRADARPRRIGVTSDGSIWYGDYSGGMLGRYRPSDGSFKEWLLPGGAGSWSYGMAVDDRDHVWVAETGAQPNNLAVFDPVKEQFVLRAPVPSGGGTVRHMYFHAPTRTIWFGTDTNYIARAAVP